jgi:hypothetical protein
MYRPLAISLDICIAHVRGLSTNLLFVIIFVLKTEKKTLQKITEQHAAISPSGKTRTKIYMKKKY